MSTSINFSFDLGQKVRVVGMGGEPAHRGGPESNRGHKAPLSLEGEVTRIIVELGGVFYEVAQQRTDCTHTPACVEGTIYAPEELEAVS